MVTAGFSFTARWRQALAAPCFVRFLATGLAMGVAVVWALPHFFGWVGQRQGILPPEPLLGLWEPRQVSMATFLVLYGVLLLVLAAVSGRPGTVLRGLYAYLLMTGLRMAAMALVALEPPPAIIPLVDPVTQLFYPGGTPFLKDLFFSGHTATLVLLALMAPAGHARWLAALGAAAVAVLVLAQHVHWTVDVLAAVPAAWLAWALAGRLLRNCSATVDRTPV